VGSNPRPDTFGWHSYLIAGKIYKLHLIFIYWMLQEIQKWKWDPYFPQYTDKNIYILFDLLDVSGNERREILSLFLMKVKKKQIYIIWFAG
jgi:hypothetical protein